MSRIEIFLLCFYFLGVGLIIYQSFNSEILFSVEFQKDAFSKELEDKNIQNLIAIQFKFKEQYETNQLTELPIIIKNQSPDQSIYVDWERSALIDLKGRSQRVVRLIPRMTFDLFQPQPLSTIPPMKTLEERVTAEGTLKRDSDSSPWKVSNSLLDLALVKKHPYKNHRFLLQLNLRLSANAGRIGMGEPAYDITCTFHLKKLHWTVFFPWNRKK